MDALPLEPVLQRLLEFTPALCRELRGVNRDCKTSVDATLRERASAGNPVFRTRCPSTLANSWSFVNISSLLYSGEAARAFPRGLLGIVEVEIDVAFSDEEADVLPDENEAVQDEELLSGPGTLRFGEFLGDEVNMLESLCNAAPHSPNGYTLLETRDVRRLDAALARVGCCVAISYLFTVDVIAAMPRPHEHVVEVHLHDISDVESALTHIAQKFPSVRRLRLAFRRDVSANPAAAAPHSATLAHLEELLLGFAKGTSEQRVGAALGCFPPSVRRLGIRGPPAVRAWDAIALRFPQLQDLSVLVADDKGRAERLEELREDERMERTAEEDEGTAARKVADGPWLPHLVSCHLDLNRLRVPYLCAPRLQRAVLRNVDIVSRDPYAELAEGTTIPRLVSVHTPAAAFLGLVAPACEIVLSRCSHENWVLPTRYVARLLNDAAASLPKLRRLSLNARSSCRDVWGVRPPGLPDQITNLSIVLDMSMSDESIRFPAALQELDIRSSHHDEIAEMYVQVAEQCRQLRTLVLRGHNFRAGGARFEEALTKIFTRNRETLRYVDLCDMTIYHMGRDARAALAQCTRANFNDALKQEVAKEEERPAQRQRREE